MIKLDATLVRLFFTSCLEFIYSFLFRTSKTRHRFGNNKHYILSCFILFFLTTSMFSQNGKKIFNANCVACHTIGKGHLVGPDLKGVTGKHTEDWLLKWIKSSQSMVKSKDPQALALYNQNNQIVMPDQPLSDEQIKAIIDYIKTGNGDNFVANVKKDTDKKSENENSTNTIVASNNNSFGIANFQSDNKVASSPASIKSNNENSPSDNKTASSPTAIKSNNENSQSDNKVAFSPTTIKPNNENSQSDNKSSSELIAANSINENSQPDNKTASTTGLSNNEAKTEDSKPSNPDRMFLLTGLVIVMLFFLGILITMVMVIKTLLTALGKKYDKELSE